MYELYWIDELGYERVEQHFLIYQKALECIKEHNKKCKKKYRKKWILQRVVREKIDLD